MTPEEFSVANRLTEETLNALPAGCHVAERGFLGQIEGFLGLYNLAGLLLFHFVCNVFDCFDHAIVPISDAGVSLFCRVNFLYASLSFKVFEVLH